MVSKMLNGIAFSALLLSCCTLMEPKHFSGNLEITFSYDELYKLSGTQDQVILGAVYILVMLGDQNVHEGYMTKVSNTFRTEMEDLTPADDYSILVLGKRYYISNASICRAMKGNISVEAGEVSRVNMSWRWFKPFLETPYESAVVSADTVQFQWESVTGADYYYFRMDRNNQFLDPIIRENRVLQNRYSPGIKYPDGKYYWKVGCIDSFEFISEWSDPGSFEIRKPGRKEGPDPLSPPDRAVLEDNDSLYFHWNAVSGADSYIFWLSTDSNFTYITAVEEELSGNQYHSVPNLNNGIYFWKVVAKLPDGEYSEWSSVFRFSMNEQPLPAPELIAPEDSAYITSTEIFYDWSHVEDADYYELMVDQNREFVNPVIYQKGISESHYTCTFQFESGTYYWLVRAVNQKGEEGIWSSFRSFTYESLEKRVSYRSFRKSTQIP